MPNTLGQVIAQATATLSAAQVDSPKLAAQVLLAHALGWPRASVVAAPSSQDLQSYQLAAFRALVARCANSEPLAFVVGHTEFYGLDFVTDRRALIPRPETEHLVELALARIQALPDPKTAMVDVGTGTGCIVISLAAKRPDLRFLATDSSSSAL